MGKSAFVEILPSSASEHRLRRQQATHGEAVSVSTKRNESPDHSRGFQRSDLAVLIEPEPIVAAPQPIWVNGTRPGSMAGKRPAPKPTGTVWGA